jgi:RNA polymerase sigma-70 factor, ECF subfamily
MNRSVLFSAWSRWHTTQSQPATPEVGPTDAEIVRRTLGGDRQAFEVVVRRHERAIYTHLIRMVGRVEDAEDLTQETFLLALRGLNGFDQRRPLRPWLFRIAANAAFSALRRRPPPTLSLDADEAFAGEVADRECEPADKRLEREELRARLDRAIESLSAEEGAIFNLCYRERMSHQAIAAVLGRKAGAVTVALHRLRMKLRRMVFGDDEVGASKKEPKRRTQ